MNLSLPVLWQPTAENDYQLRPFADVSRSDGKLNVAGSIACTDKHGPNRRYSLWLQQCFRRCLGCTNGHMLSGDNAELRSVDHIATSIATAAAGAAQIEGITLQGGEPLLQARNLASLLKTVRERTQSKLSVLLFTGYTMEQLQALQCDAVNDVLRMTDTVIDGSFQEEQLDDTLIRGSKNQRIIHLTPALEHADFSRRGEEVIFTLGTEVLRKTGINISDSST